MNRLTKKINECYCSQSGDFYDLYNKLGQLEDIENELGIELLTLFKALTNGIWYKKEGHSLHTEICLNVNKEWVIGCWLTKYECIYCHLKDYGKTWALTKEELENGNIE